MPPPVKTPTGARREPATLPPTVALPALGCGRNSTRRQGAQPSATAGLGGGATGGESGARKGTQRWAGLACGGRRAVVADGRSSPTGGRGRPGTPQSPVV
ncbi:hypothetical protein KILIM_066_00140 [Kineosphaera limosa NBRC 100340]|uniref:Uncharacterized protein n=1 Tax=Kineosphaera limosa NBRC 100340 TaxID=1184609 RepID=K6VMD9_9MICO|nr:hypothetical protein KILIM_066_00140 [Kineosphaera limosa NBRC 100340]